MWWSILRHVSWVLPKFRLRRKAMSSSWALPTCVCRKILSLLSTVISEPNKQKIAPNAYTLQDAESADALAPLMGLSPSQQQPDYKKLMYGLSPGLGVKQPLTIAEKQLAYMVSAALHSSMFRWKAVLLRKSWTPWK